jgi:hypothetical protein
MSYIDNFEQLGYTSDHVRRDISVTVGQKVWKGFTWNLQEKCYSKQDNPWGYSNNPFNCTETKEQYELRKLNQINIIIDLCKIKRFDFGALQEVDFCFPSLYNQKPNGLKTGTPSKGNLGPAFPDWLVQSLTSIKTHFVKSLESINFDFVTFEDKEIVIIYLKDRLSFKTIYFDLPFKSKWEEKNHLALATFQDSDGESIVIGSMHGNYNDDYSQSVPNLLKSFRLNNQCVIIGGDMNHPPKYNMSELLVLDDNEVTNFNTNYSSVKGPYTLVQLDDSRSGHSKAYDGFLVTMGIVEVSGDHVWSKIKTSSGKESPVLLETKLTRKFSL